MDLRHKLVRSRSDHGEGPHPSARARVFPVLPKPSEAKWRAVLHPDRERLLHLLPEDRLPLKKGVDGQDAAALRVGVPKHRQLVDGLRLSVDWRRLGLLLGPVRYKPPLE